MSELIEDLDSFSKIREAIRGVAKAVDSAAPQEIWATINDVEYYIIVQRNNKRRFEEVMQ